MPWCTNCLKDQPTEHENINGFMCCTDCGKVLQEEIYSSEVTYIKTGGGQSHLSGAYVHSVRDYSSESRERTLKKGRNEIHDIVVSLCVSGGANTIDYAHNLYKIAVERNFTKGRNTKQVAAVCVYIVCRQEQKPYLLIDFSDFLQLNVYVLGGVFLRLCKVLRLEEHPIVQKLIDPKLFIHRFSTRLLGKDDKESRQVGSTAMRIIASMKRDWMQTGRKPSGLCGAAIYISALSYGLKCSKSDVVTVVHICEATLTKRLIEFENTESGSLTIEEFTTKAEELEAESRKLQNIVPKMSESLEVLCEHKGRAPCFVHGLCKICYEDFIKISGGIHGGSEPAAFQRAEKDRMAKALAEKVDMEAGHDATHCERQKFHHNAAGVVESSYKKNSKATKNNAMLFSDSNSISALHGSKAREEKSHEKGSNNDFLYSQSIGNSSPKQSHGDQDVDGNDESETLSDIDDVEVNGYLHDEEETRLKTIIWTEMNKEYLEEQAAKEAVAAAQANYMSNLKNYSGDNAAFKLAAATATAVEKIKKERRQKRIEEAKNSTPAQTAAEATRQMLSKKRLSSKINYDVLDKLFDDSEAPGNAKRQNTELVADNNVLLPWNGEEEIEKVFEPKFIDENDQGFEDEYEEYAGEDFGNCSYYENQEDDYGYEDDH